MCYMGLETPDFVIREQARQEAIKQAEYDHAYQKRLKELKETASNEQLLKGKPQTPNNGLNYWDRYPHKTSRYG